VRDQAGNVENYIAIENDITSRVETENQLRRAKAEADFASRAKSEFLARFPRDPHAHERRDRHDQHPHGDVAHRRAARLRQHDPHLGRGATYHHQRHPGLLEDRVGQDGAREGPFELALCVEEALDLFAPTAAAKRLEIGYHVEQDVPPWIVGDVTRLRQIIVNLVNNALKFTPSGSISIQVRRIPLDVAVRPTRRPDELEISVQDTGIGIPRTGSTASSRPSARWTRRRPASTGTASASRYAAPLPADVRRHPGRDTPGKGSTFTIAFMTDAAQRPAEVSAPAYSGMELQGTLALCIEDNPSRARAFARLFDGWAPRASSRTTRSRPWNGRHDAHAAGDRHPGPPEFESQRPSS